MRDDIAVYIGAAVAVLLQIIVAPNIAIFFAMPNFIMVYVCVIAMIRPDSSLYIMAFVMGLVYDLLGNNPVGLMSILLLLMVFFISRAFALFDNEAFFVPFVMLIVTSMVIEVAYGCALLLFGLDVSFVDAVFFRSLPCALYDSAMGLILLPLIVHIIKPSSAHVGGHSSTAVVRFR